MHALSGVATSGDGRADPLGIPRSTMKDWLEVAFWACAFIVAIAMWLMVAVLNLFFLAVAILNPTPGKVLLAFLGFFLWPVAGAVQRQLSNTSDGNCGNAAKSDRRGQLTSTQKECPRTE